MKTCTKGFILAVAVLFVTVGCSFGPYTPDTADATAVIQLRMPRPTLFGSSASRAMSPGVDKVTFILKQAGAEVTRQTITSEIDSAALLVTPGTGYTLEALVYNTLTDPGSPMVRGESAPFDAVGGETVSVPIVCIPDTPVLLTDGTESGVVDLDPFIVDLASHEILTPGQEEWFSFTTGPTDEYLLITVNMPDEGKSGFQLSFYNSDGIMYGYAGDLEEIWESDGPFQYMFECEADTTYYLGALSLTYLYDGTQLISGGPFTVTVEGYVPEPIPVTHDLSVAETCDVSWDAGSETYVLNIPEGTTQFVAVLTLTSTSGNPVDLKIETDTSADMDVYSSVDPETGYSSVEHATVSPDGSQVYLVGDELSDAVSGDTGRIIITSEDDPFAEPREISFEFHFLPAEP